MLAKNRILLFTDWYEPGFKAGGPIQSSKNIVNSLSDALDFWIFTSDRDLGDTEPYKNIETDKWLTLENGAHIWYASPAWLKTSNIRSLLKDVKPDVVYLNSMFSSSFSLLPLWVLRSMMYSGRIILAPRGMLNTSAVSRKKWRKKIFLSLFSFSRISKKIIFHATDKQEEEDIKKYFRNQAQVYLIENIPNISTRWQPRHKQPGQLNCVFISRIHPIKNLLFAINILKGISGCSVLFDIYGTIEDEKYYQKCREAVSRANPHININFKGPVANARIFDVLQNYHVFFLPTQGENFGHVIFEALTSGCVLLISDKTPWKNLEENNAGWAISLNDTKSYLNRVRELCMMSESDFNVKSLAAHDYARKHLGSMNFRQKYLSLFQATE